MRHKDFAVILAIICLLATGQLPAHAEGVPRLADVPEWLPSHELTRLNEQRRLLILERHEIREKTAAHNQQCTGVEEGSPLEGACAGEQKLLEDRISAYADKARRFNESVGSAMGFNELLGTFSGAVVNRTRQPNEQAREILRSFGTVEQPIPVKNMASLAPGDVILVAPIPSRDIGKAGWRDVLISNGINLLDRWGSENWSSPASHAAVFLGERNGKRWYLDNTSSHGPVIKEEPEFLKEYGKRKMDVATLVGQPLSLHEAQELWKGAHELRNTTSYGIKILAYKGDDAMVCSESARWLLLRAGRRVPETQSPDKKILNTELNKKQFVTFSPSDFYESQQYFLIHRLNIEGK
jgi:hypothetical protein